MELKLKKRVLSLEWEGEKYQVTFPTYKQGKDYQAKLEGVKDDVEKQAECMESYLVSLGLPQRVMFEMEFEHIMQVIEVLAGSKKK